MLLPGRNIVHRRMEALPHRTGAVGRRDAAAAHVFENIAREIGDDQAVEDNDVVMKCHCSAGTHYHGFRDRFAIQDYGLRQNRSE